MLSGEMPAPITDVARHAWIVASLPGHPEGYLRWELGSGGRSTSGDPLSYFGHGDVAVHGVLRGDVAKIEAIAACLDASTAGYRKRHPDYFPIPGPNSNTIIAEALRACPIYIELPATAIGRDYLGPVGVAVTEGGTGVQLESVLVGVRVGLREGFEVHVAGLALGVHLWTSGEVHCRPLHCEGKDCRMDLAAPFSVTLASHAPVNVASKNP